MKNKFWRKCYLCWI